MNKITGVYKVTNTTTGDFYIGSSIDVKRRWQHHKCPSVWAAKTNKMYKDMQKYGVDKFKFTMVCFVVPEHLHEVEQEAIEMFNPTYNRYRAEIIDHENYQHNYYEDNKAHKTNAVKERNHRLCNYKGETLTFGALKERFRRRGVENPYEEAKKYLA